MGYVKMTDNILLFGINKFIFIINIKNYFTILISQDHVQIKGIGYKHLPIRTLMYAHSTLDIFKPNFVF